jgi:hypothetical protein
MQILGARAPVPDVRIAVDSPSAAGPRRGLPALARAQGGGRARGDA